MRTNRLLGAGLVSLGGLVIVCAVLGPLVLVVVHFRTSVSGLNQIRGGDLAALALVVVVPACLTTTQACPRPYAPPRDPGPSAQTAEPPCRGVSRMGEI